MHVIMWGCSCITAKGKGLKEPGKTEPLHNSHHSLQVDVIDVVGHNTSLFQPSKQHSIVFIHFGDGKVCTGGRYCPADGRGGPYS